MTRKPNFGAEAWSGVRPHALAAAIDIGVTLTLWVVVLVAHFARRLMGAAGVDPEFVGYVALGEKWVFLSSFAGLFWRILERSFREIVGRNDEKSRLLFDDRPRG
jgi:hypothetical protein